MQILMDTMDVRIYNMEDELVATFDCNQKALLRVSQVDDSYFGLHSATINLDFLHDLSYGEKETDFQVAASGKKTIKINPRGLRNKYYKIVANGVLYDRETAKKSHNVNLIAYRTKMDSNFDLDAINQESFQPNYIFKLLEDGEGNFVDLQLEEI